MKPLITITMTVTRVNCRCPPAYEDIIGNCNCPESELERTVSGTVDGEDVELLFLADEDGRRISLGELSMQEQDTARERLAQKHDEEAHHVSHA